MSIECRNLTKAYKKRRILSDLSLSMNEPGVLCVLGPNGSGKTTLLRIMAGLEAADSGQITYFGKTFNRGEIRSVGVCFASLSPVMLNRSVAENLAYPMLLRHHPKSEVDRLVRYHLDYLGLSRLKDQNAMRLSAGEKQKLSLGRALIAAPRILLLDEPTASIDVETQSEIESLLLCAVTEKHCHIVLATHQAEQAARLGGNVLELKMEVKHENVSGSNP